MTNAWKDESRAKFEATIKALADAIASSISSGKLSEHERGMFERRLLILERITRYFSAVVERVQEPADQAELYLYAGHIASSAHSVGANGLTNPTLERIANEVARVKTRPGREAALKSRHPAMSEKKRISIDSAEKELAKSTFDTNHALVVAIRPTIEKQCKKIGVKPPSFSSITGYVKPFFDAQLHNSE